MDRARRAAFAAVFLVMALGLALAAAPPRGAGQLQPAALVAWPTSTLVISEIQTGGASASDEFVELANAGPVAVDLAGLEIVYVTASGSTVTRKASWPAGQPLEPGRHLLVANGLGIHAAVADAIYSGGFAATGGVLVLRAIGGATIDAVGWGDASTLSVEGTAAPAPPAGSSIERRPGGMDGNGMDTNDNVADFFVQGQPSPQPLAAPPVPLPTPIPSLPPSSGEPSASPSAGPPSPAVSASPSAPVASAVPSTDPSASPSGPPTAEPSPIASGQPSSTPPEPSPITTEPPVPSGPPSASPSDLPTTPPASPTPSPSPEPSGPPEPTAQPSDPGSPSPTPSASPSPSSVPTVPPAPSTPPAPTPISIAEARDLPLGQQATIRGVLTTPLGLLEDGRVAFVQDASAGIAVYVDPASAVVVPPGAVLVATGTLDERYGARTLRVSLPAVVIEGPGSMPTPEPVLTGSVGESVEGRRITVTGTTSGAPTDFADGLGILVDDGSGPVRAIVSPDALDSRSVPAGSVVTVVGPVGQRDSSGTGAGGYRIHATSDGDLVVQPPASPSPSPNPSSSPSPSAAPSLPAPTASPTPSPGSMPRPIGEARGLPIGATVTVAGVVTAEAGRLGTPRLIAIEDATGGLVVKLAEGLAAPGRGSWIEVEGVLADPFGQLELRVGSTGLRVRGNAALPLPAPVTAAQIGEGTEARLVVVSGSVPKAPTKSAANDIAFDLVDGAGDRIRITADASSGLSTAAVRAGRSYRITGIAAQRASRKGALDGYRVWLRDGLDLVAVAAPPAGVGISTGAEAPALPIAEAVQLEDGDVTVEGSVTASASLLDTTGRRIVLQDGTGAVEVLLPSGAAQPGPGSRLRVEGTMGRAYGAPRLRASAITKLTGDSRVEPRVLVGDPGASVEWQLVKLSGTVGKVTRLGARWRAELERDGRAYLIDGLPGSSIPSTALVEGRAVSVVGVVRRPYPAATDRRFAIVPRSPADVQVRIGGSGAGDEASAGAPEGTTGQQAVGLQTDAADVDLGALAEHAGEVVRVGGLVVEPTADGFSLDDGTAIGVVVLDGDAAAYRGLIEAGDAVNAVGVVQAGPPGEWFVRVTEPGALLRVGDLGQPQAIGLAAPTEAPEPPPDEELVNPPETTSRRLGFDQLIVDIGGGTGLASLGLMTALSVAVAAFRRRRARACAARLAARLERYAGVNVNPGP